MARSVDLMGAGIASGVANLIGTDPTTLTCTGTSSGTAAPITFDVVKLNPQASQTGAILPALGSLTVPSIGMQIVCTNPNSTTAVVYPPSGATFNTSASTSINIAQFNTVMFVYFSATQIFTIVSA